MWSARQGRSQAVCSERKTRCRASPSEQFCFTEPPASLIRGRPSSARISPPPATASRAGFFIKRLRVLLAVHPPSVHHIATRCHGNDHSLGDSRCRCCGRSRVLLIGKPLLLLPHQSRRLGWDLRMLRAPTAKAGSCVGCAAESESAESFSFLGYLLKSV